MLKAQPVKLLPVLKACVKRDLKYIVVWQFGDNICYNGIFICLAAPRLFCFSPIINPNSQPGGLPGIANMPKTIFSPCISKSKRRPNPIVFLIEDYPPLFAWGADSIQIPRQGKHRQIKISSFAERLIFLFCLCKIVVIIDSGGGVNLCILPYSFRRRDNFSKSPSGDFEFLSIAGPFDRRSC